MSFQNTETINDLIKRAELEVLLERVAVDADRGTIVIPVRCPAKGRVNDYQMDEEGQPACVFNNRNCGYFGRSMFDLNGYVKQVICNFEEGKK